MAEANAKLVAARPALAGNARVVSVIKSPLALFDSNVFERT